MIIEDRDALLCDFAETYHIYDLRALPLRTMAALACGLRDDARIMMKIRRQTVSIDRMLSAAAVDRLALLAWQNTKDGQHNRNRPRSVLDELMGKAETSNEKIIAFETGAEFRRAWAQCVGG